MDLGFEERVGAGGARLDLGEGLLVELVVAGEGEDAGDALVG